ncbi:MAG: GatB/YqeY domain-containing protein [Labilithrix sp.]|nr:GatB/YqeY domain-containing protein [Labilithrix sp.]MBX3221748.1 GatB/YqeY domain-containing protein [Labilithrix sp.]
MLVDDIKKQITGAMKSGDAVARDVLRLALSEIQTTEARKNTPASDEDAINAVRKLIKSNEETLGLTADAERAGVLRREVEVLSALLPKQLSVEDIVAALASEHEAIKAAKTDGQATGVAMKHLKSTGASVSGNDVGAAVKKIRG